jgi:RNA recognition motif-containing protein
MTNIYVGNLDFTTLEDQLQTLFAAYGAVKTVTAVTDRDTGQPRGFAFVEMTNAAEARDAIRTLNGSVHGGRALIVNEARPKLYRNGEHESLPSRNSCFTKWGLSTLRQSSPRRERQSKSGRCSFV